MNLELPGARSESESDPWNDSVHLATEVSPDNE